MWDVELSVVGSCRECGEDLLAGAVRIRSTASWIERYHADVRLQKGINQAVVKLAQERHTRTCTARRQQRALLAATA